MELACRSGTGVFGSKMKPVWGRFSSYPWVVLCSAEELHSRVGKDESRTSVTGKIA